MRLFSSRLWTVALALVVVWSAHGSQDPPRVDGHGDPLPDGAVARLGTVRFRVPGRVAAVAFSHDGKLMAVAVPHVKEAGLRVWETETGKEIARFGTVVDQQIPGMLFTPDGKLLLGQQRSVDLYDWKTGKLLHTFAKRYLASFALSPDGKTLAVGSNEWGDKHSIYLWDMDTRKELPGQGDGDETVRSLHFSADGKRLLYWVAREVGLPDVMQPEPGVIRVWDLAAKKKVHEVKTPTGTVAFAPDGESLAFFGGGMIHVVNPDGKVLSKAMQVRKEPVKPVVPAAPGQVDPSLLRPNFAFTPDGKQLLALWPTGEPILYDPTTGKEMQRLPKSHTALGAISPNGKYLAVHGGTPTSGVTVRDLATGKAPEGVGHQDEVMCVAYSPDGKVVATGSSDHTVRLWDAATGKELHRLEGHERGVTGITFAADGKSLATSDDVAVVRHWKVATGEQIQQIALGINGPLKLEFSPDGLLLRAVNGIGNGVTMTLGRPDFQRFNFPARVQSSVWGFTPDTQSVLLIEPKPRPTGTIQWHVGLRSVITTKPIWDRAFGLQPVAASLSPDGRLVALSHTPQRIGPQSLLVAQGLEVLERATGERLCTIDKSSSYLLALSPDGRFLAAAHPKGGLATDTRILLWDTVTGEQVGEVPGHHANLRALAFAPDGKTLASAASDHTVLVWDVARFTALKPAAGPPAAKELDEWWLALSRTDPTMAYQAVGKLTAHPDAALAYLRERLHAAPEIEAQRIAGLIKALDSPRFAERQKATEELTGLGERAVQALRNALAADPPEETRRRIEQVIDRLERAVLSADQLREVRALIVLERVGTPEARQVLDKLASGPAEARITLEARAALGRLDRKKGQ